MKKIVWLLPLLLFACKKSDDTPARITIEQKPHIISVFSIDPPTSVETLLYEIRYFYNSSSGRYDSIRIAGTTYAFDYTLFTSDHKIRLNYNGAAQPYSEIQFDASYYTFTFFNEIFSANDTAKNALLFDNTTQLRSFVYTHNTSDSNFARIYTNSVSGDSIFVHTSRASDNCNSYDTIINSRYDMSVTLSWLLFSDINTACGTASLNILRALPSSNHSYKLPSSVKSGDIQTSYDYAGDSNSRLAQATITRKILSSGAVTAKYRISIQY
jgi:hypothetical protein